MSTTESGTRESNFLSNFVDRRDAVRRNPSDSVPNSELMIDDISSDLERAAVSDEA